MKIFGKKKKSEILDFTELQKRGVKNPEIQNEIEEIDLSSSSSPKNSSEDSPNLGFLGGFAAASSESRPITNSLRAARQSNLGSAQINEMKLKLDDNDYKLSQALERIKKLENRLRRLDGE